MHINSAFPILLNVSVLCVVDVGYLFNRITRIIRIESNLKDRMKQKQKELDWMLHYFCTMFTQSFWTFRPLLELRKYVFR